MPSANWRGRVGRAAGAAGAGAGGARPDESEARRGGARCVGSPGAGECDATGAREVRRRGEAGGGGGGGKEEVVPAVSVATVAAAVACDGGAAFQSRRGTSASGSEAGRDGRRARNVRARQRAV